MCLLFSVQMRGQFRIQLNCNEQSINPRGSSLEHDLLQLQIEFEFFLDFQCRQASMLFDILITWHPLPHLPPSRFKLLHATRLGKQKDTCNTAAVAAVTAAASNRVGRLAAVGFWHSASRTIDRIFPSNIYPLSCIASSCHLAN
jgi:hypothetical protein